MMGIVITGRVHGYDDAIHGDICKWDVEFGLCPVIQQGDCPVQLKGRELKGQHIRRCIDCKDDEDGDR